MILEGAGLEFVRASLRTHVVVASCVVKGRAAEAIRAALRHHIHARTHEVALPHVIRRNAHLHLLKRVDRNRRHAGPVTGLSRQTERIIEVGTVDRHVVQAVVLPGEREPERHRTVLRREPQQILDSAADRRQMRQLIRRDRRRGAGPPGTEHGAGRRHDRDRIELHARLRETELQIARDPQRHGHPVLDLLSITDSRGADAIRPTYAHPGDRKSPVRPRNRGVRRPRWPVHRDHARPFQGAADGIIHDSGDRAGGDALSEGRDHRKHRKHRGGRDDAAKTNDPTHGWTSPWREGPGESGPDQKPRQVRSPSPEWRRGQGVRTRWVLSEADTRPRRRREYSASRPRAQAATRRPRRPLSRAETSTAR